MNKPIPKLTDADLARFWGKVDKSGDCWLWTMNTFKSGYGSFGIRDYSYRAHRISYTIANGDPGELNVNHTCDNPRCVNPLHLWLGTQREGMDDKVAKDRQTKGEANVHVLTERQVKRFLYQINPMLHSVGNMVLMKGPSELSNIVNHGGISEENVTRD